MRRVARSILPLISMLVVLVAVATPAVSAQELTFSVAISMKEVTEALGRRFTQSHPGVVLRYSFGASGDLQKQIEAGAPVDLFISAAQRQMDELEKKGLIVESSRKTFARNVLTIIKAADSKVDIAKPADLLEAKVTRIAVGNPRTVPVGQYAEESLRALGLWDTLQPKLVFTENVRQALDYVARGEVEAGFVYTTDAAVRGREVKEAVRPPEDSYRPVTYPVAMIKDSKQGTLAGAFIDLLVSAEGQQVLARQGFLPPPPATR